MTKLLTAAGITSLVAHSFGYSECYIPEVIESYKSVPSWPAVELRAAIVALEGAGGKEPVDSCTPRAASSHYLGDRYVTDAQLETSMAAVSAEFSAEAGITFQQTRSIVVSMQSSDDSAHTNTP